MQEISKLAIALEGIFQCNESVFFKFTKIFKKRKEYIYLLRSIPNF